MAGGSNKQPRIFFPHPALASFRHPSELNPLQRFLQARRVLRTTSRATNPFWFTDALHVPFQLHVRIDGTEIRSWLYHLDDKRWEDGPEVTEACLTTHDAAVAFAASVLDHHLPPKTQGLGVVLHIADEFSTAALDPDHDTPAALKELRTRIESEPSQILDDSSLSPEDYSWRVLPYSGTGAPNFATAITVSRRYQPFLVAFLELAEQRNFPIRTAALSAPLVTLQTIPYLIPESDGQPILCALHYPFVTVLAFFNGHGDLLLLRTLQHRGHGRPVGLRHAATTTAASLEIASPSILVLPLANTDSKTIAEDLGFAFPGSRVSLVNWSKTPFASLSVPEPVASRIDLAGPPGPLAESVTFASLRDEGWSCQDFLPPAREMMERYPTRSEIKLLRTASFAHLGIAALTIVAIAWVALTSVGTMRQPEWSFNPAEAQAVKQRLAGLNLERLRIEQWDNLLEDRSKAWPTMELLCRLFPERCGVILRTLHHAARPDTTPGKAKVGFVKEWRFSGYAREEAQDLLNSINSQEGISAIFADVAKSTGNQAFQVDLPSRSITVKLSLLENATFKPRPIEEVIDSDESTYPYSFDLLITQRFESADPTALAVTKAPPL